jgi:LacI family transcriptional regulator
MEALLASGTRPEAVFTGNDLLAAGALHACRDAGLSVPRDLRLAGFGDFPLGPDLDPPLTTVAWPLRPLAERAVDALVRQLHPPAARAAESNETLATDLVIRTSA